MSYFSFPALTERPGFGFYGTTPSGGAFNDGTIFRVTSSGVFHNNKIGRPPYSFDGTHGEAPYASLVLGNDGNFYGTTVYGGVDVGLGTGGVAFKVTPGGVLKVLHDFNSPADRGWSPFAGLIQASDGNFYGVTFSGGAGHGNQGVAYKLTPNGVYSQLYYFDGMHGGNPGPPPIQHSNGKIYGIANYGGAYNGGVFYSLDLGLSPCVRLVRAGVLVGQTMGVLGQGLVGTTSVYFDNVQANFTVVSDTYLTAIVPAGAVSGPGRGFVVISTPSGKLVSNEKFIVQPVISGFSPNSGPVGTQVVVTGSGLTGLHSVTFDGVRASFVLNSDSQLTATVPTSAKTGKIIATAAAGTAKGTSSTSFTVTP